MRTRHRGWHTGVRRTLLQILGISAMQLAESVRFPVDIKRQTGRKLVRLGALPGNCIVFKRNMYVYKRSERERSDTYPAADLLVVDLY